VLQGRKFFKINFQFIIIHSALECLTVNSWAIMEPIC
jgi:hypothetical protein